ncbi:ATP-binding cassette domain-containing protein, partial [Nonomuraea sp. NPDC004297]
MTPAELLIEDVRVVAAGRDLVLDARLRVSPGEVVALAGPNGAGKSTLLRTLYRARRPTSGRVLLDGEPLSDFVAALREAGAEVIEIP